MRLLITIIPKDPIQSLMESETWGPIAPFLLFAAFLLFIYIFYRFLRYGAVDMWLPKARERKKVRNAKASEKTHARIDEKVEHLKQRTQPLREAVGNAVRDSPPPPLPNLVRDQPWRGPTATRYLEELKEELTNLEDALVTTHTQVKRMYDDAQHNSPGILVAAAYGIQITGLKNASKEIEKLTARIENIYRGVVGAEIIELEIEIRKTERRKPLDEIQQEVLIELRAGLQELQGLKTSRKIDNVIKDDQKMDSAKQRQRRDVHFQVHSKLGKNLHTLAEIQNFETEQCGTSSLIGR
jgi:hypothetical protein